MRTFRPGTAPAGELCCELLILADGTVLAQNLTEKMAAILSQVAPHDSSLKHRASRMGQGKKSNIEQSTSNVQPRTTS